MTHLGKIIGLSGFLATGDRFAGHFVVASDYSGWSPAGRRAWVCLAVHEAGRLGAHEAAQQAGWGDPVLVHSAIDHDGDVEVADHVDVNGQLLDGTGGEQLWQIRLEVAGANLALGQIRYSRSGA